MITRRVAMGGAFAIAAGAPATAGCAGHGAWLEPPSISPYVETLHDQQFASAAAIAGALLREAQESLGVPSLTAAVAMEGRLVWSGAVGYADLGARRPASPGTVYRIGSTSKAVTSTVLARLVDEGRIGLDQPIGTLVADPLPNPSWAALTPRMLSSHTAGLPGYDQNRDLWGLYQTIVKRRRFTSVRESLEVFDDTPLLHAPGERYLYSSFDVNLLSYALEAVGGASYLDLVRSRVTMPLDLRTPVADGQGGSDSATFYVQGHAGRWQRWREVDLSEKWASGGLAATSADLARMGVAWLDPQFIRPQTRTTFWTEQKLNNGQPNGDNYAIGWRVNRSPLVLGPDRPLVSVNHAGVSQGALSWLNIYPELGLAIALNTNARGREIRPFLRKEPPMARPFAEAWLRRG